MTCTTLRDLLPREPNLWEGAPPNFASQLRCARPRSKPMHGHKIAAASRSQNIIERRGHPTEHKPRISAERDMRVHLRNKLPKPLRRIRSAFAKRCAAGAPLSGWPPQVCHGSLARPRACSPNASSTRSPDHGAPPAESRQVRQHHNHTKRTLSMVTALPIRLPHNFLSILFNSAVTVRSLLPSAVKRCSNGNRPSSGGRRAKQLFVTSSVRSAVHDSAPPQS